MNNKIWKLQLKAFLVFALFLFCAGQVLAQPDVDRVARQQRYLDLATSQFEDQQPDLRSDLLIENKFLFEAADTVWDEFAKERFSQDLRTFSQLFFGSTGMAEEPENLYSARVAKLLAMYFSVLLTASERMQNMQEAEIAKADLPKVVAHAAVVYDYMVDISAEGSSITGIDLDFTLLVDRVWPIVRLGAVNGHVALDFLLKAFPDESSFVMYTDDPLEWFREIREKLLLFTGDNLQALSDLQEFSADFALRELQAGRQTAEAAAFLFSTHLACVQRGLGQSRWLIASRAQIEEGEVDLRFAGPAAASRFFERLQGMHSESYSDGEFMEQRFFMSMARGGLLTRLAGLFPKGDQIPTVIGEVLLKHRGLVTAAYDDFSPPEIDFWNRLVAPDSPSAETPDYWEKRHLGRLHKSPADFAAYGEMEDPTFDLLALLGERNVHLRRLLLRDVLRINDPTRVSDNDFRRLIEATTTIFEISPTESTPSVVTVLAGAMKMLRNDPAEFLKLGTGLDKPSVDALHRQFSSLGKGGDDPAGSADGKTNAPDEPGGTRQAGSRNETPFLRSGQLPGRVAGTGSNVVPASQGMGSNSQTFNPAIQFQVRQKENPIGQGKPGFALQDVVPAADPIVIPSPLQFAQAEAGRGLQQMPAGPTLQDSLQIWQTKDTATANAWLRKNVETLPADKMRRLQRDAYRHVGELWVESGLGEAVLEDLFTTVKRSGTDLIPATARAVNQLKIESRTAGAFGGTAKMVEEIAQRRAHATARIKNIRF